MIKNYRNGLLAAAVALVAVGCDGGLKKDNPLSDPQAPNVITGGGDASLVPARAIAQLLGSTLSDLIGQTEGLFDTLSVITSPNTNPGKLLSSKFSTSPSGLAAKINAPCTKDGDFVVNFDVGITPDGQSASVIPSFENGLDEFATGVFKAEVAMEFDKCNEPTLEYDGDDSTTPQALETDQVLNGKVKISAESSNELKTPEGALINNDKDFLFSGVVSMDKYFIQKRDLDNVQGPVDLIDGTISFAISSTDVDTGVYAASIGFGMLTANGDKVSAKTNISADGTITLDKLAVAGYNLSLTNGNIRKFGGDAAGEYDLFTQSPIVSTDGGNPSAGIVAIIHKQSGLMHTAEVTNTGVTFNIYEEGKADPVVSSCTWNQVNNVNGEECLVN